MPDGARAIPSIISRRPLSAEDMTRARAGMAEAKMEAMYLPDERRANPFNELLHSPDPGAYQRAYPFDISPVSDNRPFFFYTVQPRDLWTFVTQASTRSADYKINRAVPLLFELLAVSLLATLIILGLPPLVLGARLPHEKPVLRFLLYFLAIGAGYILVEVALIQKFVLFLGHPTYALTVVIFSMLVSSGLGSYYSRRLLGQSDSRLRMALVTAAALLALMAAEVSLLPKAVGLPLGVKMLLTAVLIFPAGFVMGMPFPTGLARLERWHKPSGALGVVAECGGERFRLRRGPGVRDLPGIGRNPADRGPALPGRAGGREARAGSGGRRCRTHAGGAIMPKGEPMATTSPTPNRPATAQSQNLEPDFLIRAFRLMHTSRRLDDREVTLKRQNKIYFQVSCAGHEAIETAAGLALRPGYDWVYPYYRNRALALAVGVTPYENLLQAVGAASDPASGGRQMASHWSSPKLNIVAAASPTGMQMLQAVGCAHASRYRNAKTDEVTLVSIGDGATSEGEFWEAMNVMCLDRLPVLVLVEDNGYAISVPLERRPRVEIFRACFPVFRICFARKLMAPISWLRTRRCARLWIMYAAEKARRWCTPIA